MKDYTQTKDKVIKVREEDIKLSVQMHEKKKINRERFKINM